jgi:16S rRNA G966 N2-methylase RsmD
MLSRVHTASGTRLSTKWAAEKTPLVVVRAQERNRRAYRGGVLRRNTEFAIIAVRVDPEGPTQPRNLGAANNVAQLRALDLPTRDLKLSEHSNVIQEYKPPRRDQRLKDAKGNPFRQMAEKSVDLNAQILARFTHDGDTILDVFAGTCGLGVSVIALGGSRKYVAIENDEDIIDAVQLRLGRAHLLLNQQRSESETTLARLVGFQNLASACKSFMLPPHNIPEKLINGRSLSTVGSQSNLDWVPPRESSKFEIKATGLTVNGLEMGEGLYLKDDATPIEAGEELPELYFFGQFVAASALDAIYTDGVPGYPGVFELRAPVADYCLIIDERCPAAKINDARGPTQLSFTFSRMKLVGTQFTNNVVCHQSDVPATLHMQQKLFGLLVLRTTHKILPGEQVWLSYGHRFWKETKSTAKGAHNTISNNP